VVAVLRHLRDTLGASRFVLTGSCFDARTALSALLDEPEAIAGIGFVSAPVMAVDTMRELRNERRSWGDMLQAVARTENWKRLGDPGLWRAVETRLRGRGTRTEIEEAGPPLDAAFLEAFSALEHSRARALFLYGDHDQEFHTFEPVLRRLWPALSEDAKARLEIDIWPGVVHDGFLDIEQQERIVGRVLDWVLAFHPAAAHGDAPRAGGPTTP
jgi:pimeloyl-ACP methyl ester carboxylesterase